jgi:uncharacterized protein YecT (DUF1311 family)
MGAIAMFGSSSPEQDPNIKSDKFEILKLALMIAFQAFNEKIKAIPMAMSIPESPIGPMKLWARTITLARKFIMTIGTKVRNLGLLSLVFIGMMAGQLNAQNKPTVDCTNPTTQMAMNTCAGQAAKASDQQLNIAYKKVQQSYRGSDSKEYRDLRLNNLTNAQLAWIKYRDTNCEWQSGKYSGGSMASMVYSSCIDRLTQQRTQELLSDLEG